MYVKYDYILNELDSKVQSNIPKVCKRYLTDENRRCKNFYDSNRGSKGFIKCPYGFYTYFSFGTVYTSLILQEDITTRLIENLKKDKQKTKDFSVYDKKQVENTISFIIESSLKVQMYEDVVHDFVNITNLINTVREKIETSSCSFLATPLINEYCNETKIDMRNLCALSELISYRLKILNDIKSGNGKESSKSQVKIHKMFNKFVHMFTLTAQKKDVTFKLSPQQDNIYDLADEVFLGVYIIFENAVKYSLPEKYIRIKFYEDSFTRTVVEIENICDDIDEDEIDHFTDRGFRGSNAAPIGSGIGLFKAKQIFEKNKIDFQVETKKNINNTTFTITLTFKR